MKPVQSHQRGFRDERQEVAEHHFLSQTHHLPTSRGDDTTPGVTSCPPPPRPPSSYLSSCSSSQTPSPPPPPLLLLLLLPSMLCLHKLIVVNDGSVWSRWPQRALKRQSRCVVSPAHPLRFTLRPHPPPHPPPPIHPSTSAAPSQWALRSRRTRPLFFFSLLNDAASASTLSGDKLLMSGWGGGGGV